MSGLEAWRKLIFFINSYLKWISCLQPQLSPGFKVKRIKETHSSYLNPSLKYSHSQIPSCTHVLLWVLWRGNNSGKYEECKFVPAMLRISDSNPKCVRNVTFYFSHFQFKPPFHPVVHLHQFRVTSIISGLWFFPQKLCSRSYGTHGAPRYMRSVGKKYSRG